MDNQELIWVDKVFAEKYKELSTNKNKRDEQEKVFNEYLEKVQSDIRRDFQCNLDSIEEDAAIFTGLMLKVKQAFEKAKNEHLDASYELWENFDKEIPSVQDKVDKLVSVISPLQKQLAEINSLLSKISTWNIDKFNESISLLANTCGKNKDMIEFLVKNFK